MKLSYTIEEACEATSLGRTKLYAAIASGQLIARKCGKRTVILKEDLLLFLSSLQSSKGVATPLLFRALTG